MKNISLRVARDVAKHVIEAEIAIDQAFVATARLAAFMPEARQMANVSAELGQHAFQTISKTIQILSDARKGMVETHQALAATQEGMGMRERNFGGFIDKAAMPIERELMLVENVRA